MSGKEKQKRRRMRVGESSLPKEDPPPISKPPPVTQKELIKSNASPKGKSQGTVLMKERSDIAKAERVTACPVNYTQYLSMWRAFQENPSVKHVSEETKIRRSIVSRAIEAGWEDQGMPGLAKRLADVRKAAQQIADYDLAQACADNAKLLRAVKLKLRQSLGPGLQNFSIDPNALQNMSLKDAKVFTEVLNGLMRLEAFTLREGEDSTMIRHTGSVQHEHSAKEGESAALGKLSRLANRMESVLKDAKELEGETILDAEFSEPKPIPVEVKGGDA